MISDLIDCGGYPESYADGLVEVEHNGPTSALIFYRRRIMDRQPHRVICAHIILPTAELLHLAQQLSTPPRKVTNAEGTADDASLH